MKTKKIYRLAVGPDGPTGRFARLDRVYHVSHLGTAIRILEDGLIAARSVNDDSCLDEHRVSVSWLAPNQWSAKGSRYGTVQFAFDFVELLDGKRLYWIEGVTGRSLAACRILVTDRDIGELPVKRFRPKTSEGPLRLIEGEWFWRDDLELELLVEGDLPLSKCVGVTAVPHQRDRCGRGSAYSCKEVGRSEQETAARILAAAAARRFKLPPAALIQDGRPTEFFRLARAGLIDLLNAKDGGFDGKLKRGEDVDPNVRAALLQVSTGDMNGATDTISAVASGRRIRSSLKRLLERLTKHAATQLRASAAVAADRGSGTSE